MEWISENWIWLALGVGMVAMHMFGHGHGSRGGHGTGHGRAGPAGGCCGTGSHDHGARKPEPENAAGELLIDPVCRKSVPQTGAKTAVIDNRIYRFCSKECREAFEASPESYLEQGGEPVSAPSRHIAHHAPRGAPQRSFTGAEKGTRQA